MWHIDANQHREVSTQYMTTKKSFPGKRVTKKPADPDARLGRDKAVNPARIYDLPEQTGYLDHTELEKLESSFRVWSRSSSRADVRASRKRIFLIFLLIRYTGAKLNEVLEIDLNNDIDLSKPSIRLGASRTGDGSLEREIHISSQLALQIEQIKTDPDIAGLRTRFDLRIDPGHVRRKFYERCLSCGLSQELASPNAIRKSRAIELMQSNVPLPVVQRILGHSTPNLTASLMTFSEEDIRQVARQFVEKESRRKSSARNSFFGKIAGIQTGDIQSKIELITPGNNTVTATITNTSLKRLGLKRGLLITAEIKAPWVILQKGDTEPLCTAENVFRGNVTKILRGKLITEFVVTLQDGTDLCSVVTEESRQKLGIQRNDDVWVMFNSFAVVLHVD
jgi:molybdate transport system regulatory protein